MDYFIAMNQILILFLLIGVGYFARRIKILNDASVSSLSKFLLHICIPAMVIFSMQIPFTNEVLQKGEYLVIAAFAYYGIAFLVAWFSPILMRAKREEYGVFRFMIMFSNSMFMGFPVLAMLYGQEAIFYAAIFNIPFTVLTYSVGIWILRAHEKGNGKMSFNPKLLLNPAFLSTILGLIFFLASVSIPDPIYSSLELLNNVTTPLSLVVTGGFLAQLKFASIFKNVRQYIVAAIRLLGMPVLVFLIFSQFIQDQLILWIIVITAGMPAAVNTVMLAEEHKAHPDIAAQGICISTLLCLVTLPMIAMFLTG
ncbi:MAG TPA: AEC family transporter [Methanocorpusculum sp.]|nr:AEC family transporter [Methanocorpusculum sp.]